MHALTALFVVALVASTGLRIWLARRQIASVRRHRDQVPEAFADTIRPEAHRHAADYSVARTRLGVVDTATEAIVLLGWTLGGGLAAVDQAWRALELPPLVTGIGVLATVVIVGAVIDLPLRVWRTFGIEARFGFNRTTPGLFIADQLRAGGLLLALGTPLAAVILWLMQAAGSGWWIHAWAVWLGFNLLMVWAWPAFIAPLFNRFTPLEDTGLRTRIEALLTRCGFASNGVYVIDGSRRSGHGNAYFSGLGRNKRIVFFDTLLEQLDADEVEAVLAHELGHFRHHHIAKNIALMALASLGGLALLAWLMEQQWFYTALGVPTPSIHAALALFMLVLPVFTFFLQPLFAWLSRRHEFEADAFAAAQCRADHLVSALINLYRENANTLTPDPLWSAFHDSHPPAAERIAHLRRQRPRPV
ncbi:M48 family metallopeptidase [Halofilum ochraceum]|uniref:M48 family metallopeptidase n=1 Tax=Halofilum ochraceum TaxID=1611323 RepID=UPI0008DB0161|nr:M48 family metallopeptidase [Halofilum ochraceum]